MDFVEPTEKERAAFTRRLTEALARSGRSGIKPAELAREFSLHHPGAPVTAHGVRKWMLGQAIPTQDKLRTLAEMLEVDVQWLRFGNGSGALGSSTHAARSGGLRLTQGDYQFIQKVHSLDPATRRLLFALVDQISPKG